MRWAGGKRILVEAAVESAADAQAAEAGGADRLELCAALDLGGLTPSVGAFHVVRESSRLPVVVMIRPRPGDFVADDAEVRVMVRDVEQFLPLKPAGFVFGCLGPDGRVQADACRRLLAASRGAPCVFHRAFDRVPQPPAALDLLAELGFARVLTSGRASDALHGAANIAASVMHAAGRLEVLPCGRVRAETAVEVLKLTGCDQLHGSFAEPVLLPDSRGYRGYQGRCRTSEEQVAAVRAAVTRYAVNFGDV